MMSEQETNRPAHARTYTYREYLERYSGLSVHHDDDKHAAEEQDPEKIGEEMGKGIIERLIAGR